MECRAHAFGFGDVVAQIQHDLWLKEYVTTQHSFPFVGYPNSIDILFTHLAWTIERALSTTVRFSCSAAPFCSGAYGMVSRCVIPCSSITFCTASQLNSLPPSDSRTFVTLPAVFTSFTNLRRQSATSLFVVMKNTMKFRIIIFEADVRAGTTHRTFCYWTTQICVNLFSNYAWSTCPNSEALPMCFSQSTTVTKLCLLPH